MSIPVWVLLAFALWTLLTLFGSVGVYRWSRILTGRQQIREFTADAPGADWYNRAMRAHANCIENLPIYGAVVIASLAANASSETLDLLAILLLIARVLQTVIHIAFEQTNTITAFRFGFFLTQAVAMIAMGWLIARAAT